MLNSISDIAEKISKREVKSKKLHRRQNKE